MSIENLFKLPKIGSPNWKAQQTAKALAKLAEETLIRRMTQEVSIENINDKTVSLEDESAVVQGLEKLYRDALKARRTRKTLESLGKSFYIQVSHPSTAGSAMAFGVNGNTHPECFDRLTNLLVEIGDYSAAKAEKQISEELDKLGQLRNPTGESTNNG